MTTEKPDPNALPELANLRILVVEDNSVDREITLAALRKMGTTIVQVAETGNVAINKIQNAIDVRKPFELILLDAKMPGQDGNAVLKWMRNQTGTKSVAVIMITATSNADDVAEYAQLGISGYVVKPLKVDVLRAKLHEALLSIKKKSKTTP
jgi:CheY-like chemotaxis protein